MATVQEYLDAYDRQLRTEAETPSAVAVTRLGPLRLVTFAGGRGFVTYRDLGGADRAMIGRLGGFAGGLSPRNKPVPKERWPASVTAHRRDLRPSFRLGGGGKTGAIPQVGEGHG